MASPGDDGSPDGLPSPPPAYTSNRTSDRQSSARRSALRDVADDAQGGPSALSTPLAAAALDSRPVPDGWLLQHDGAPDLARLTDRGARSNRPYYLDLRDTRRPSSSWVHPLDLPPSPSSPAPSSPSSADSPTSRTRRSLSPTSRQIAPRAPIPRALSTPTSSVLSPHARRYSSPAQTQAFALADNFLRQPQPPPSPAIMRRQSSNDPPGMTIAQLARQRTDGASPPAGLPSSAPVGGFVVPSAGPSALSGGQNAPTPRRFSQSPDPLPSSAPVVSFAVPPYDRADELADPLRRTLAPVSMPVPYGPVPKSPSVYRDPSPELTPALGQRSDALLPDPDDERRLRSAEAQRALRQSASARDAQAQAIDDALRRDADSTQRLHRHADEHAADDLRRATEVRRRLEDLRMARDATDAARFDDAEAARLERTAAAERVATYEARQLGRQRQIAEAEARRALSTVAALEAEDQLERERLLRQSYTVDAADRLSPGLDAAVRMQRIRAMDERDRAEIDLRTAAAEAEVISAQSHFQQLQLARQRDMAINRELALENAAINADLALGVGPMSAGSVYGMAHPLYGDPYLRDGDLGYGSLGAFDDPFYDDGLY